MKPASVSPSPSLIRIVLSCMMLVLIPAESANTVELLNPSNVTDISFESNTTRAKIYLIFLPIISYISHK